LTQSPTEMSTRNLPGGNGRPARGADNLHGVVLNYLSTGTNLPLPSVPSSQSRHDSATSWMTGVSGVDSLRVQTDSGAHPASSLMGTGGSAVKA
jgi:hypothetical protein